MQLRPFPITLALLVLVGFFACFGTVAQAADHQQATTPAQTHDVTAALVAATDGRAQISLDPATGVARFVRLEPGSLRTYAQGATATQQALSFLQTFGDLFGIKDPTHELQWVTTETDVLGATHVVYQQVYHKVPVFAGTLRVHFNAQGQLVAVNGVFIPDLDLDITPGLSQTDATQIAQAYVADQVGAERSASPAGLRATAQLYLFRSNLVQGIPGHNYLAYEVEVRNDQDVHEFVYIDAQQGAVIEHFRGSQDALQRRVYKNASSLDAQKLVWQEGDPSPYTDADASAQSNINRIIDYTEDTYNFFAGLSGGTHLSWDRKDGVMNSLYDNPAADCPNAGWNSQFANFCLYTVTDDTVAHEWAHGYTRSTHNLIYRWQPGALNEAYSDIWGETIDLLNGAGGDAPDALRTAGNCSLFTHTTGTDDSKRWLLFEDARSLGLPARELWNPGCFGNPGKVSDSTYVCTASDDGGVHANSGVPNHAYALLVDGGQYNEQTVMGIGLTKAANLYWRAQTIYHTRTSDFADHADALEQSCTDLIGAPLHALDTSDPAPAVAAEVITAADCAEVSKAIAAVELRREPTQCRFQTILNPSAPALCANEGPRVALLTENWESGLGAWTVGTRNVFSPATFSTPDWAIVSTLPDARPGAAAFVEDGKYGDGAADSESGVLFLESPPITLPTDALVPRLAFEHWFATEANADGGNLSLSVNGGPFTVIPQGAFTFNPYNGNITTPGSSVLASTADAVEPAFTGTNYATFDDGSWGQSQVSLFQLAQPGDTVQLRFQMHLNPSDRVHGWYVDDVQAYYCQSCNNGKLNVGESCDDGNTVGGDGCSPTCQIEPDWYCKDPQSALAANDAISDGGFEVSNLASVWQMASTNADTLLCGSPDCPFNAHQGRWLARFGHASLYERSALTQTVLIPAGARELTFFLSAPQCDSASDYLEVLMDGRRQFLINGSSPLCGSTTYTRQAISLTQVADGQAHTLVFNAETFARNGGATAFLVDDINIFNGGQPAMPSRCAPLQAAYCRTPGLTIPDGVTTGVTDSLTLTATMSDVVPANARLADLDVYVNAHHTWLGDLQLTLEHIETGKQVTLLNRPGASTPGGFGCSGDDMDLLFDDEGSAPAEQNCQAGQVPALRSNLTPGDGTSAGLLAFDDESLAGRWVLTASDLASDETGSIEQWCLVPVVESTPTYPIFLPIIEHP